MTTDTIEVTCQCGRTTRVPSSSAGRSGRCKGCGSIVRVPLAPDQDPTPSPVFVVEEEQAPPKPKKAKSGRQTDEDFSFEDNAVHYLKAIEKSTRKTMEYTGCLAGIVLLSFIGSVIAAVIAFMSAAALSARH